MHHDEPSIVVDPRNLDETGFSLPRCVYGCISKIKPDVLIIIYGNMTINGRADNLEALLERYKDIPKLVLQHVCDDEDVPFLVSDNYVGMGLSVRHLIEKHGYRRIAFVSGPRENRDSNERFRAFRDVMAEYDIPIDEERIVYGNYTDDMRPEIATLLDRCPDTEAIVFANDHMAEAGYRECKARGLVIGKDIAITGFDNSPVSQQAAPPMTTVAQSSMNFSHWAIKSALDLYHGKKVSSYYMPCELMVRNSCGCKIHRNYAPPGGDFVQWEKNRIGAICDEMFRDAPYKSYKINLYNDLNGLVSFLREECFVKENSSFDFNLMVPYLEGIIHNPYIKLTMIGEHIFPLMEEMADHGPTEEVRIQLQKAIRFANSYLRGSIEDADRDRIKRYQEEAWFLCEFTRGIVPQTLDVQTILVHLMQNLQKMDIAAVYFYLYEWHHSYRDNDPEELFLSAYYNEDIMESYPKDEWKSYPEGLARSLPTEGGSAYFAYPIFSGEEQFGLMIAKVPQEHIYFMMEVANQVGTVLHMAALYDAQAKQNLILQQLSTTDPMTGLMNRRGYYEAAINFITENTGKLGAVVSMDLDHLKEINDTDGLGHDEGDFAILAAASYMNACFPDGSIVARVGGDEFRAIMLIDSEADIEALVDRIKKSSEKFNANSGKPYYVEITLGYCVFDIHDEMELTKVEKKSDASLYENKATRRPSSIRRADD